MWRNSKIRIMEIDGDMMKVPDIGDFFTGDPVPVDDEVMHGIDEFIEREHERICAEAAVAEMRSRGIFVQ